MVTSIAACRHVSRTLLVKYEGADHVLRTGMVGVELTVLYRRCSVFLLPLKAEMTACAELSRAMEHALPFATRVDTTRSEVESAIAHSTL